MSVKPLRIACAALSLIPSVAFAQADPLPKTCDASMHDLMRSRAWMEAQREVEVSETLILKPDSILDYSCFSDLANSAKGITLFQEDIAGHVDSVLSAMNVSCKTMADITETMRCTDADKAKILPSLTDLVDGDIRPSCSGGTRDQNWADANDIVFAELPRAVDAGGLDPVVADTDKLDGTQCGGTYVFNTDIEYNYNQVVFNGSTPESEAKTKTAGYCLAPGCTFNGSACVSEL